MVQSKEWQVRRREVCEIRGEVRPAVSTGRGVLARVTGSRGGLGFLTVAEVGAIGADPETRLTAILVRMGGCRFVAAAQDAVTIARALEAAGDYVRDYSLTVRGVG